MRNTPIKFSHEFDYIDMSSSPQADPSTAPSIFDQMQRFECNMSQPQIKLARPSSYSPPPPVYILYRPDMDRRSLVPSNR